MLSKKWFLWIIGLVLLIGVGFGGYYIYDSHSKAVAIAAKKEKFKHAQDNYHRDLNTLLQDLKGVNQIVVTTWADAEDNNSVVVGGKRIDTSTGFDNAVDRQTEYQAKIIQKHIKHINESMVKNAKTLSKNKTSKSDDKIVKDDKKAANNLVSYSNSIFDPVGNIDEFDATSRADQRSLQSKIDDLA